MDTVMSHGTSVSGWLRSLRFGDDGSTEEIHLRLQDTQRRIELIRKYLSSRTRSMMMNNQPADTCFPLASFPSLLHLDLWPSGFALSSFLPSRGLSALQRVSEGLCRAAALRLRSQKPQNTLLFWNIWMQLESSVKRTQINKHMWRLTLASTVVCLTMFSSRCWWLVVGLGPQFFFSSCFCTTVRHITTAWNY